MDDDLIPVFVAVAQAGARQGQIRWVNPADPDIARRLSLGFLQRLPSTGDVEPEVEPEAQAVEDIAAGPEPLVGDGDEAGLVVG